MLINCSHCRSPLVLPPAAQSLRCALCNAITMAPSPPPPPPYQHRHNDMYSSVPSSLVPLPLNAHGSKKALICGVSYRHSQHELKGCLNDAKCMKFLLTRKFNFPESSILLLTEDQTDPLRLPTKHNMRMAMHWLISGCQPGDSLVFHYSGHGAQQRNFDNSEVDGMDETILPLDFETQGMIVDNEMNMALVRPLPPGVRLHAIVDACHSGTVLDLPFLCKFQSRGQYVWEDHRPRNGAFKGTSGGEAFCFSGCDDHQTSADTSALSQVTYTGAMTFCFIQAIERGRARTYSELLNSMRYDVQGARGPTNSSGDPIMSLIDMLVTGGSLSGQKIQEPQLTSSSPFDIGMPFTL